MPLMNLSVDLTQLKKEDGSIEINQTEIQREKISGEQKQNKVTKSWGTVSTGLLHIL